MNAVALARLTRGLRVRAGGGGKELWVSFHRVVQSHTLRDVVESGQRQSALPVACLLEGRPRVGCRLSCAGRDGGAGFFLRVWSGVSLFMLHRRPREGRLSRGRLAVSGGAVLASLWLWPSADEGTTRGSFWLFSRTGAEVNGTYLPPTLFLPLLALFPATALIPSMGS